MAILFFRRSKLNLTVVVVGCIFFSAFVGFRIQRQLVTVEPSERVSQSLNAPHQSAARRESVSDKLVFTQSPPLPHLVANTTFFTLPGSGRAVTPLRSIDREQYTIRILSWKRAQFLAASVALHSQCPGVKQIQVVWSVLQEDDDDTDTDGKNESNANSTELPPNNRIPQEVLDNPKVVIEKRTTNRLNNRFDILPTTPTATLGVVSMDDDLIYTCDALDMGFFLWAQHHGERMVTYAPRRHVVLPSKENQTQLLWRYRWYKNNEYSLGLTSTAFLHRDYLYYYTHYLPRPIYQHIQDNMNCEDIAMSLFVSNLTNGTMPLAVDEWGILGRLQFAAKTGYEGIKAGKNHMVHRSGCVDWYATELGLKDKFKQYAKLYRVTATNVTELPLSAISIASNDRFLALEKKRKTWVQMQRNEFNQVITQMQIDLKRYAAGRGLSNEGHGR